MKTVFYIIVLVMILFGGCVKSQVRLASPFAIRQIQDEQSQPPQARVYFPFASDHIMSEAVSGTDRNISWLATNPDAYVILEGHCDEVGPAEYNMELGDRRARAIKAYMIKRGIPAERVIMIVSYGSTRPLNPGHRVVDLRENRRVEFILR